MESPGLGSATVQVWARRKAIMTAARKDRLDAMALETEELLSELYRGVPKPWLRDLVRRFRKGREGA